MRKLLIFVLTAMTVLCAVSCSAPDSGAAREIAIPLIEASQVLDEVLYGEGLDTTEEKKEGKYSLVVSEEYKCLGDIKEKMSQIYTPELAEIISNSTLRGTSTEHGTNYAHYIDVDGELYRYDEAKVYVKHPRKYDFDSIKATNMTDIRIIFEVDTYTADEQGNYSRSPERIELKLIWDDAFGKWLLDTPTY